MKWYIVAAILMTVGMAAFVIAMCINKWEFTKLSTTEYVTNEYEITEDFNDIRIDVSTAFVVFEKSENDLCKVVCHEEVKLKHKVKVEDGALIIEEIDERTPLDYININFSVDTKKVTIYLPKTEYEEIKVNTSTGNIHIAELKADTMNLNVSTGNVYLTDVTCDNLTSEGSTGNTTLTRVVAAEKFYIKRSTGNVKFEDCDASEIEVKTSTGNVRGNFLTDKVFDADASTGKIEVPDNKEGGKCVIRTSTGNIIFE